MREEKVRLAAKPTARNRAHHNAYIASGAHTETNYINFLGFGYVTKPEIIEACVGGALTALGILALSWGMSAFYLAVCV